VRVGILKKITRWVDAVKGVIMYRGDDSLLYAASVRIGSRRGKPPSPTGPKSRMTHLSRSVVGGFFEALKR